MEVLLRHGAPVTLPAINKALGWHVEEKVLELLLAAGQPRVPLGSEEAPELWRADMACPFYSLLCHGGGAGAGRAEVARKAELLLAAGYRPATYCQLVTNVRVPVELELPGIPLGGGGGNI